MIDEENLREQKNSLINNILMPKMKTIIVDNSTSITEALIKENIKKIDSMQDTNKGLKVEISRTTKHSEIIKKSNEELDNVIEDLEERLT